jgi:arylsulfatase A-like enzyme
MRGSLMLRWGLIAGLLASCSWTATTPEPEPKETRKGGGGRSGKAAMASKADLVHADPNRPVPTGKPNVLVIVWDTVRADHLSTFGYDLATTPGLDAWAKEARVYENAISPGMWTLPSHASLFTGLPESSHGANAEHHWLDKRFLTVSETFLDAGWSTFLYAANPYLQDHTNLGQGFETREFPTDDKWRKKAKKATMSKVLPNDASNTLGPAYVPGRFPSGRSGDKTKDSGPVSGEALAAWLDERPDKQRPFFAVLNMMEAHVPRIPSLESRKALFSEADIAKQLAFDESYGELLAYTVDLREFTPDELRTLVQVYDAALRDLDAATTAIIEGLKQRGLLDNTIVVLTADHGEHLGDHHRADHKFSLYDALVHVPLVIRYPGKVPAGRDPGVVSNLDVYATLTELAGLSMPEGTLSQSLLRADRGEAVYAELAEPTRLVFDRMKKVVPTFDTKPWERTYDAVVTQDLKCIIRSDGNKELYSRATDPEEKVDLSPQRAAEVQALCDRIAAWKATFPKYDPSKADKSEGPEALTDEVKKQLEDLGYLSGEEEKPH